MYLLVYDRHRKYKYAYMDAAFEEFKQTMCPACDRAVVSLRFKSDTHQLILEGGKKFPDYLQFTGAGEQMFLLSEKSLTIFKKNDISGIGQESVVMTCDEELRPLSDGLKYYCVDITGRIELDFSAMNLKKKRFCAECGQFEWNRQRIEPLFLDENTWDGSDVCRVTSIPGYIVCSSKVVDEVKRNGLSGFSFFEV